MQPLKGMNMKMLWERFERWIARITVKINEGDAYYCKDPNDGKWQLPCIYVIDGLTSKNTVRTRKYVLVPRFPITYGHSSHWQTQGNIILSTYDLKYQVYKGAYEKIPHEQIPTAYKTANTTTQYNMES